MYRKFSRNKFWLAKTMPIIWKPRSSKVLKKCCRGSLILSLQFNPSFQLLWRPHFLGFVNWNDKSKMTALQSLKERKSGRARRTDFKLFSISRKMLTSLCSFCLRPSEWKRRQRASRARLVRTSPISDAASNESVSLMPKSYTFLRFICTDGTPS